MVVVRQEGAVLQHQKGREKKPRQNANLREEKEVEAAVMQARLNGSTLPTISSSTDADDAQQLDSEEEQPLFLGRASATPAPATDSPFARWDVPEDPTELPSETRRKAASRRVADAVENARLRSLNQTTSRHPNAGSQRSHTNRTVVQAKQEEAAEISDDDPVLASPTLAAPRQRHTPAHVKNETEVIEIKSEDDDDGEDDFQIVSPPPAFAAPATPTPRIAPAPPTLDLPRTPPPVAQRQAASAAARKARSATASAASSSSAARQALVGRQPSVAPLRYLPERNPRRRSRPKSPCSNARIRGPTTFSSSKKTFRAINTVYSFCSARKHMATTYDTIKSSVEGLTKKPLQIFDIAQIKSLCGDPHPLCLRRARHAPSPHGLPIQRRRSRKQHHGDPYIPDDQTMSVQSAAAAAPLAVDAAGFDATGGGFQDVSDAHESGGPHGPLLPPTELEVQQLQRKGKQRARDEYVLLFEFNDGTLQGPKATARGGRPGMRRGPNRDPRRPHRQAQAQAQAQTLLAPLDGVHDEAHQQAQLQIRTGRARAARRMQRQGRRSGAAAHRCRPRPRPAQPPRPPRGPRAIHRTRSASASSSS
ncbi:hypothetical protein L1887_61826 [Cichorium endivia]|nr:hypothetical protein L1887_61826 [Cichorium endivia]